MPFPSPGDLLDAGIKPVSLASPALAGGFFTTESLGKCGVLKVTQFSAFVIKVFTGHFVMCLKFSVVHQVRPVCNETVEFTETALIRE